MSKFSFCAMVAPFILVVAMGRAFAQDGFMDAREALDEEAVRNIQMRAANISQGGQTEKKLSNIQFVFVPAGRFLMGSSGTPESVASMFFPGGQPWVQRSVRKEFPQHDVTISKPFWICKYEVTMNQFAQFVDETGYVTQGELAGEPMWGWDRDQGIWKQSREYSWDKVGRDVNDNMPVVNVGHADAVKFCEWLSKKQNATFRLPTEAEWEFACRAGTTTAFSFGDDLSQAKLYANTLDESGLNMAAKSAAYTDKWNDGFEWVAPVGSFRPNALGVFDMHGNVSEFCQDVFDADYYLHSPDKDPIGAEDLQDGVYRPSHVIRGGSCNFASNRCRSAFRNQVGRLVPGGMDVGFRVVCEIEKGKAKGDTADAAH